MTRTRIDNYTPRVPLPEDALEAVREAVRRAAPANRQAASLLLHAASRHAGWAVQQGRPLSLNKLFSAACVNASIEAAAHAQSPGLSPYRSRLRQLADATGTNRRQARRPKQPAPLDPPHTEEERAALMVAAAGLSDDDAVCLRAAMSLGAGAGVIGPAASMVQGHHLVRIDGRVVVTAPGVGPVIVRGQWGEMLWEISQQRHEMALTTYYTTAGRQRVRRGVARSRGIPAFEPRRLRTAWIVELLNCRVPLDAAAALADINIAALHRYTPLVSASPASHADVDAAAFEGLAPMASDGKSDATSAATILASKQPAHPAARQFWNSIDAQVFKDAVAERAPAGKQAHDLLTSLFVMLEWAVEQPGLPLGPDALLKETTLQRWASVRRSQGKAEGSTATYLAALRRLARPVSITAEPGRRTHLTDYSDEELSALMDAAALDGSSLPDRAWRVVATCVYCQLGGGIAGHEAFALRGTDVRSSSEGTVLAIAGSTPRDVTVDARWGVPLLQLADRAGDGLLIGAARNGTGQFVDEVNQMLPVALDPGRLQATWVARRAWAGASARELCAGTGLTLAGLAPMLEASLPSRPLSELIAWSGFCR